MHEITLQKRHLLGCIFFAFLTVRSIAQAPNGFHYVRTDQDPASVLYDSFHQQFFVTVPGKNELDVVSASDGSTVAKTYVSSPYGLDLSADGTRLYVTSNSSNFGYPSAEGFFVVDTTSLRVVDFVQPTVPLDPIQIFFPNLDTVPRFIAAMSNGKVFYNADQIGVTSSKIFAFDPATGISTPRPPTGGGNFYDGTIQKSANGERFVVLSGDSAGGDLWTYDSASDSYIAHLRINNKVVYDAIFSPDGTRVLAGGHLLYDQNLNQIADLNPTAGFQNYRGSTFSPDGTKIYVANSFDVTQTTPGGGTVSYSNPVVAVYQTASGTLLGYVAAPQFATSPFNRGIAVSPQGLALLLNDRGFAEMDLSRPNANLPGTTSQGLRYPNIMTPPVGSASSPSATTVNGAGFRAGASVYFGSKAAPSAGVTSSNTINAQPPPGNSGPVDVMVSFPDGWSIYGPEAYSYGPTVLYQDVNVGDINGGTTVQLSGYGFDTSNGQPQVTVGGAPATVTKVNLFAGISPFTFPIEYLIFTTPVGSPGFADITVRTSLGSATVKNGFQYVTHVQIPGVLPAQMALDESRGRLYVADVATGNVKSVDTNTLGVTTLISSSSNPATGLALTPDGGKLLVISGSGGTLTVFDLNAGIVLSTYYAVPGNQPTTLIPNGVVATSRGSAIVSLSDPSTFGGGTVYELDLASGDASKAPVEASCPAIPQALFSSTLNGNEIYIASAGAGCVSLWSAAADATVEVGGHEGSIYQLSATSLGDRILVNSTTYTSTPALSLVTTSAPNDLLVSERSLVSGGKIHSSGSLKYLPTSKGIEVYDVHHGQMVLSIGIPAGVASTNDGLAIDQRGTTLYVAEASGIGIIKLAAAPLSVGNLLPAQGNSSGGGTVTLLGSGFANGAAVSLDGRPASTQFIDSTKLTFVTPPTAAAKVAISVSNPAGDTYVLDAAYDASVHQSTSVPALTTLSPVAIQPRSGQANLTISGSGFVPTSQVMLNGQQVQTLYLSGQQIVAYLYDVQGPGLQAITVVNPAPGGGTSNALDLQIKDANPTIINLNPSTIPAGSAAFELSVFGNGNFSPDSVVLWNGSQRPTLYVVAGEVIAKISANDVAVQGSVSVTVNSPSAANPMSNAVQFTIKPQVPAASVQPLSLTFNPQVIGTKSAAATVTLTSAGQLPLTIGSISLADSADFNQTNNCPLSLSPGQTCNIQVTFVPATSTPLGPMPSKLTISDNSSGSPETVNLAASAADYQVQPGTSSATITAGQSATIALTVKSLGDALADRVQLSCSGLPTGATCNFNPSSVIPNLGGIPVTLTISTTGKTSASLFARTELLWAGLPCLFLLGRRVFRCDRRIILVAILLSVDLWVIACGGGSSSSSAPPPPNPNQTPTGTYSITVSAADGAVQRTTTVSLTVTGS